MTGSGTKEVYYQIHGMVCYTCVSIVESIAKNTPGVIEASVNYVTEQLHVSADDSLDDGVLEKETAKRGYRLEKTEKAAKIAVSSDLRDDRKRILVSFCLSFCLWGCALLRIPGWIQLIPATAIQIISCRQFIRDAYFSVVSRAPNMSLLVSIGTLSTYIFSLVSLIIGGQNTFFEATGTILVFLLIGKYLEKSARFSSSKTIESMMEVLQGDVILLDGESERRIPAAEVKVGDKIRVPGNSIISIDGTIITGNTEIDESTITGESEPVKKGPGDTVLCGTVNYNHPLIVSANCIQADSIYARMMSAMLNSMNGERTKVQRLADKVCAVFVPAVLGISVLTLIIWFSVFEPGNLYKAFSSAVSVLVAACPCALGIAVPLSISVAVGILGKSGIVVKNPAALETLSAVDVFAFDKTGTLTIGREDGIREGAPTTINYLNKFGAEVILISGDSPEKVKKAAESSGIDRYYSGLLPEDKTKIVKEWQQKHTVAMIGDGVNDLLSMTQADVSAAIGYISEINMEKVDLILSQNKIAHLLKAVYISRMMMRKARQSLCWVGIYNILAIALAAAGILTPVFSGIAMSVSSVIVTVNAYRLQSECEKITFHKLDLLVTNKKRKSVKIV